MKSLVTSFSALFGRNAPDAPAIGRIEIPILQRDYAQGREDDTARRIRAAFLDVLHRALVHGERVGLDFVYGDVSQGTLVPLDGQQRLTTLFLLHWYLAARVSCLDEPHGWKRFSYETRASARLFCERLVQCRPPFPVPSLSEWVRDQAWYLSTWRHDPTVQSMLVMLDAIHALFRDDDCRVAWDRLVDPDAPAISFHLLPLEQMGLTDDLYIKMNSRGKPLTSFEHFKARFEKTVGAAMPERADELAHKIDGVWSDLLWPMRGDDDLIDDEFMRYFDFVTELCEWVHGDSFSGDVSERAEQVYGPENPRASANISFLFDAFDCWCGVDLPKFFDGLFARGEHRSGAVTLFDRDGDAPVNLFEACCRKYGASSGRSRAFTLQQALLLYAVVVHRVNHTADFPRRLRILRNLIEGSENEVRAEAMPELIGATRRIVVDGTLDPVEGFNQRQAEEERRKRVLLTQRPDLEPILFELEDHSLLHGCLGAFHLDASTLPRRAPAFLMLFSDSSLFPELTCALLACGDYSQMVNRRGFFQLGSGANDGPWRALFGGTGRPEIGPTREALAVLLDRVSQMDGSSTERLSAIRDTWIAEQEAAQDLDWRYYLVKYDAMREGRSGLYVGANGALGYSLCMLDKQRMSSKYRDPYLFAIARESGVSTDRIESLFFTGYEWAERWMTLARSGVGLRCIEPGIALRPPRRATHAAAFSRVCAAHGVGVDHLLAIPQADQGGRLSDIRDRIQLGAALLRDLVSAGC
jgi:hypothetical protein